MVAMSGAFMMKAIIEAMIKKEVTMVAEMTAVEIMTIDTSEICALGLSMQMLQRRDMQTTRLATS